MKLVESQASIIFEQAKKLQNTALQVRQKQGLTSYAEILNQINVLIDEYNLLADKMNQILAQEGIDETLKPTKKINYNWDQMKEDGVVYSTESKLLHLIFGSAKILSFLREGVALPEQTINKLSSINKELEEIKEELPYNVYTNLKESKDEFERGGFLGSSLVSGKTIRVCLDKITGKDINQKIENLKKLDLVRDKDGVDSLIKANHYGRNLTSHDLDIFPTSSEAISYLGEAIKIAKLSANFEKNTKKEEINSDIQSNEATLKN